MTYDRKKGVAGPHVLIVGAGITGLLIAQGLKKVWLLISEHDTGVGRYIQFQAGDGYTIFDAEPLGMVGQESGPWEFTGLYRS
jgi:monoamine oxidase